MKIYVNGCSFTGGTEVIHDEVTGKLTNNVESTWATYLGDDFDVTNHAIGGNSNNKILRTSIEELNKTKYDFVIIQWTGIHRTERYSEFINEWVNFCNNGNLKSNTIFEGDIGDVEQLYGWHTDDYKHMDVDNPSLKTALKSYERIASGLTKDALLHKSLQDYRIEYFKNVLTMQNYLESNNIKYLFTSMSLENHCPNMSNVMHFDMKLKLLDIEKVLLKQIDFEKWTESPLTRIIDDNKVSQDDGHPNEKGHKLIYSHILKELNKQNG